MYRWSPKESHRCVKKYHTQAWSLKKKSYIIYIITQWATKNGMGKMGNGGRKMENRVGKMENRAGKMENGEGKMGSTGKLNVQILHHIITQRGNKKWGGKDRKWGEKDGKWGGENRQHGKIKCADFAS